MRVILAGGN